MFNLFLIDLDELLKSKILLILKTDGEIQGFIIFFIFSILLIDLYSYLYLVFYKFLF